MMKRLRKKKLICYQSKVKIEKGWVIRLQGIWSLLSYRGEPRYFFSMYQSILGIRSSLIRACTLWYHPLNHKKLPNQNLCLIVHCYKLYRKKLGGRGLKCSHYFVLIVHDFVFICKLDLRKKNLEKNYISEKNFN